MWEKAPEEVRKLVDDTVKAHHHHLLDAKIGVLMRDEAPIAKGRATWGKASLVNAQWKPLLKQELDFVIWFAYDTWFDVLDDTQRKALVDHELCHCWYEDGKASMRPHDIEEFNDIIERHGNWRSSLVELDKTMRQRRLFEIERSGGVVTLEFDESYVETQP